MTWDRIRAYRTNGSDSDFDQTDEIQVSLAARGLTSRQARTHAANSGVCLSLCIPWMKMKLSAHGKGDARKRIADLKAQTNKAIDRQGLQSKLWAQGGADANYEAPARFAGIKRIGTLADDAPLDTGALTRLFTANAGKAFLMDYRWRSGSGHAVAWYYSRGRAGHAIFGGHHLYLFDPNCGEYRMGGSTATSFVGAYFQDVTDAFASIKGELGGSSTPSEFSLYAYDASVAASAKVGAKAIAGLQKNLAGKI